MRGPDGPVICRCLKCGWLFISPDPSHTRKCADCKVNEDTYEPRSASDRKCDEAVRYNRDTA